MRRISIPGQLHSTLSPSSSSPRMQRLRKQGSLISSRKKSECCWKCGPLWHELNAWFLICINLMQNKNSFSFIFFQMKCIAPQDLSQFRGFLFQAGFKDQSSLLKYYHLGTSQVVIIRNGVGRERFSEKLNYHAKRKALHPRFSFSTLPFQM